jgi:hypothetical protein
VNTNTDFPQNAEGPARQRELPAGCWPTEKESTVSNFINEVPPTTPALAALHDCRRSLLAARVGAILAADGLDGARLARAQELAEMVADCIAFSERLAFIVTGDIRADGASA